MCLVLRGRAKRKYLARGHNERSEKGQYIMTIRQVIKMWANLLFLIRERILLDGGELEGEEHAMERHLCEPHRPLNGTELS